MSWCQQEIVSATVFEAEKIVAVVSPAAGCLVRFPRQQRRKMDFLETGGVHFLPNHTLDVAVHVPAERQPRKTAGRGAPDVAGTNEQSMGSNLGVRRVVAKCSQEEG